MLREEVVREFVKLRVAARGIDPVNVDHLPRGGFRWLSGNVKSRAAYSAAEEITDGFRDLIEAVRAKAQDTEFVRGTLLYHIEFGEPAFLADARP